MEEVWDVGTVRVESNRRICHVQWEIKDFFRYTHSSTVTWYTTPFKMWEKWWYICFNFKPRSQYYSLHLRTSHQKRLRHETCCYDLEKCITIFNIHNASFMWGIKKEDGTTYLSSEREEASSTHFSWDSINLPELQRNKTEISSNDSITFFINIFSEKESTVTIPQEFKINKEEIAEEEEDEYFDSSDVDNLIQHLKDLFLSQQDCDVTIKVEEREFKAHKAILAARSTVLASMIKNNIEESKSSVINIPDCDPDAFRDFLHYLYTAKVDNFSKINVLAFYVIANKYNVKELALKCVKLMVNRVTVDSFCDFLALALKNNESELMEAMEKYFTNHSQRILVTPKWQSFIEENPSAANELFIKFSSKVTFT